MSSVKRASAARFLPRLPRGLRRTMGLGTGLAAIAVIAGCSDDVTRFDVLGDLFGPARAPATGYAPSGSGYRTGYGGYGSGYGSGHAVEETSLPPVRRQHASREHYRVPGRDYGRASARRPEQPWRAAKAHGRGPFDWWSEPTPRRWVEQPPLWTDSPPASRKVAAPFPWPDAPAERHQSDEPALPQGAAFQGHYTMRHGDTLASVAKRYKVSLAALKYVNGITDTRKVKRGTVLAIPERGTVVPRDRRAAAAPRVVQSARSGPAPSRAAPSSLPKRVATAHTPERSKAPNDALPQPAVADGKFRWPARGRIITRFGIQPDGSKSDGIDLSVPMGTDIHAAEAGRVHYVGDDLKDYGKLILIRHANGWVSAYAHADRTLVKAGDEVKRGQVIGKAGKTGSVSGPRLRFELRKGSVPVDPLPHLAG